MYLRNGVIERLNKHHNAAAIVDVNKSCRLSKEFTCGYVVLRLLHFNLLTA